MKRSHLASGLALTGLALLLTGMTKADSWLQLYYMPSGSMRPTIVPDDKLLVNTRMYNQLAPRRGEVAIFKAPQAALIGQTPKPEEVVFVKRVVGVPGDKLEIINCRLRLNGKWDTDQGANWNGPYRYDCKIVNGKVYSREHDIVVPAKPKSGPWTENNVIASDQAGISRATTGSIPPGQFFMLGDNRTNSNDSHVFGLVPRHLFRGRVLSIIYPPEHRRSF